MGAGALAEDRWDHVEGTSTRSAESLIWAPRRKPGESGEMMRKAPREAGDRAAITSRSAQSRDHVLECFPGIIRSQLLNAIKAYSLFDCGYEIEQNRNILLKLTVASEGASMKEKLVRVDNKTMKLGATELEGLHLAAGFTKWQFTTKLFPVGEKQRHGFDCRPGAETRPPDFYWRLQWGKA
ncbi:hypothetical protein AXG93_590s1090 [Marchantia polymorpha subsp. ruderalis]|uniref:Uncharacterized protein n=1 Tax=Marchantia polymorpha subsp. ruderalis TaxID=1480154 RepID=A0A176VX97_MARPO|nr:hypothetical protein AXG93_590s1090 [Marchantia polymorpha subsp. ruderalis]